MVGALDSIAVDAARGALTAKIVVDHIGIEKAAGIEAIFSGSTLDEVGAHDPAPARGQAARDPDPGQGPAEHRAARRHQRARCGSTAPACRIAANVSRVFAGQGTPVGGDPLPAGRARQDPGRAGGAGLARGGRGRGLRRRADAARRQAGRRREPAKGSSHERERCVTLAAAGRGGAGASACGARRPHDARRSCRRRSTRSRRSATRCGEKLDALMQGDPMRRGHADAAGARGRPDDARARADHEGRHAVSSTTVTLELKNLKVKKSGTVKKVITIGAVRALRPDPPRQRAG